MIIWWQLTGLLSLTFEEVSVLFRSQLLAEFSGVPDIVTLGAEGEQTQRTQSQRLVAFILAQRTYPVRHKVCSGDLSDLPWLRGWSTWDTTRHPPWVPGSSAPSAAPTSCTAPPPALDTARPDWSCSCSHRPGTSIALWPNTQPLRHILTRDHLFNSPTVPSCTCMTQYSVMQS